MSQDVNDVEAICRELAGMAVLAKDRARFNAGDAVFLERAITALRREAEKAACVYDGYAVFTLLTDNACKRTSIENVSDTLDALAKLQQTVAALGKGVAGSAGGDHE